jgi:hypothetical protein
VVIHLRSGRHVRITLAVEDTDDTIHLRMTLDRLDEVDSPR